MQIGYRFKLDTNTANKMSTKHSDNRNIRVMQFLDAYEKQESLWNPALESYKNKNARDEAYLQIIRDLNSPTLTIHDIKLKVKSIRTTYTKELRMLTKNKEDGKPYSPKLFWFSRANSFLKDVSLARDKRNMIDKSPHEEDYKTTSTCVISYINDMPAHQTAIVDELNSVDDDPHNNHQHHSAVSNNNFEYKTIPSNELDMETTEHACLSTQRDNDADDGGGAGVSGGSGGCIVGAGAVTAINLVDDVTRQQLTTTPVDSKMKLTQNELLGYCNTVTTTSTDTPVTTENINSLTTTSTTTADLLMGANSVSMNATFNDEYDHFCRSVAAQLRRISDSYSRAMAKLKIQQILFEAETGHYRNNATISVGQHVNHL